MSVEILNFLKRVQAGIKGLQNMVLFHHTRHEKDSSDEINVAGLSGELADQQKPKAHKTTHQKDEADDLESLLRLANLLEKLHSSLTGVTSNQHHNRGNLIQSFTAGEDLNANEGVYLSGANTVSKATNANATKAIGVTIEAVSSGDPVDVCIAGKTTGIANEAISVGDILTPSAAAGRLAILTTNTDSTGAHTHTQGATESGGSHTHAQGVTGSGGSHSHTQGATGSNGDHYHTQGNTGSAGSHSHTQGATGSNGDHYHTQGNTGSASINHRHSIGTSSVASGAGSAHYHSYDRAITTGIPSETEDVVSMITFQQCENGHYMCKMDERTILPVAHFYHTHTVTLSNMNTGSESSHTHSYDKSSSQTGYTDPSHAHSNPNTSTTGSHTHTNPSTSEAASHTHTNPNTESAGSHSHSNPDTNSAGTHGHTTNIGKVLAKAVTSAASPGDTLTIIVCLGA
ncbi:hypothetical protein ES702_07237 [subsurface metagenome]